MAAEPTAAPGGAVVRRAFFDRREGEIAILAMDGGELCELPVWLLPPGSREGQWLCVETVADGDACLHRIAVDAERTRASEAVAEGLLARLRRSDPGGDVEL